MEVRIDYCATFYLGRCHGVAGEELRWEVLNPAIRLFFALIEEELNDSPPRCKGGILDMTKMKMPQFTEEAAAEGDER